MYFVYRCLQSQSVLLDKGATSSVDVMNRRLRLSQVSVGSCLLMQKWIITNCKQKQIIMTVEVVASLKSSIQYKICIILHSP